MAARAVVGVAVPRDVRDALAALARHRGTTISDLCAAPLCALVGAGFPGRRQRLPNGAARPVLALMAAEPGGVTVARAAGRLGVSAGAARQHLRAAVEAGELSSEARGDGPTRTATYIPVG